MPIPVKIMLFVYILTAFLWLVLIMCSYCYALCEGDKAAELGWHNACQRVARLLTMLIVLDVASFVPMAFWFMFLR